MDEYRKYYRREMAMQTIDIVHELRTIRLDLDNLGEIEDADTNDIEEALSLLEKANDVIERIISRA